MATKRSKQIRCVSSAIVLATIATTFGPVALAQEAPSASREESAYSDIVVTARKRAERLIDAPVAVTTVNAAQLNRSAAVSLSDIATIAPQLVIVRADSGAGAAFSLRGVGSPAYDAGIDQSVSVNIDGVQIGRGAIIGLGLFDLHAVEVLKGPQALFFGKNASAGVVSIKSQDPGDTLEGYIRAGYEFKARERFIEAAISTPLSDNLRVRTAVRASKMRGWANNYAPAGASLFHPGFPLPQGPDSNGDSSIVGRVTTVYEPTDRLKFTLKALGGIYKDNGASGTSTPYCISPATAPTTFGVPETQKGCGISLRTFSGGVNSALTENWAGANNGKSFTKTKAAITSLTSSYDLGDVSLTAVTGYFYLKHRNADTADRSSFRAVYSVIGENNWAFSQELRLETQFDGPLNLMLGAYYERFKHRDTAAALILFGGRDPVTGKFQTFEKEAALRGTTYSLFGQMQWDITQNIQLSGGVRYTREKRKSSQQMTYLHPVTGGLLGAADLGALIEGKFGDSNWSPEATLSWKPATEIMIYGSFKTGFKSGGFSLPSLIAAGSDINSLTIDSENVKGFEIGTKAELFNRALLFQATAYSYKYDNLQVASYDAEKALFYVRNAASLRVKGVELSANWNITSSLSAYGSASYNKATYLSFPQGPCYTGQSATSPNPCVGGFQDLSGTSPPRAPRWTGTAGFRYQGDLTNGLGWSANVDATYSSSYGIQENAAPGATQRKYALLNAGLSINGADDSWELALIGRNLTNKLYVQLGTDKPFGGANEYQGQLQRPREVLIQGTIRF